MKKKILLGCLLILNVPIYAGYKERIAPIIIGLNNMSMHVKRSFESFLIRGKEFAAQEVFQLYIKSLTADIKANPILAYPITAMLGTLTVYAASETMLDIHARYIDLKQIYAQAEYEMRVAKKPDGSSLMTETEIRIGALIQMMSRIPSIYWREIISATITSGLFLSTKWSYNNLFFQNN